MMATEEILKETAKDVFENLVFMLHQPEMDPGDAKPEIQAAVHFKGPFSGTLRIAVPKTILAELVANMMGEESPTEAQGMDALGELANVICGNVISRIAGPERIFDLETPRVVPVGAGADAGPGKTIASRLVLEKGCAEIVLSLDPGANEAA